jgi:multidrug transporter EmrE-like cation transporter
MVRRAARSGEGGLTLIELIVTIAIMMVSFVSVLAAISTVELMVGTTKQDALLTSAARQVGTYITTSNLHYSPCEASSGGDYTTALRAAVTTTNPAPVGKLYLPSGYSVSVMAVAQAQGSVSASYNVVSGVNTALTPVAACTPTDYGVQQIQFKVSSVGGRQSVTRIIYKRWNQ